MKLFQHGTLEMKREPANQSFEETLKQLSRSRCSTYVILEPGDVTRYDLVITRIDRTSVYVSRIIGGDPTEMVLLTSCRPEENRRSIQRTLSNGNEWTVDLFTWWIAELFDGLEEQDEDATAR